jgi:hypothetical protein
LGFSFLAGRSQVPDVGDHPLSDDKMIIQKGVRGYTLISMELCFGGKDFRGTFYQNLRVTDLYSSSLVVWTLSTGALRLFFLLFLSICDFKSLNTYDSQFRLFLMTCIM